MTILVPVEEAGTQGSLLGPCDPPGDPVKLQSLSVFLPCSFIRSMDAYREKESGEAAAELKSAVLGVTAYQAGDGVAHGGTPRARVRASLRSCEHLSHF